MPDLNNGESGEAGAWQFVQFQELKSKLEVGGIDVSELRIKPVSSGRFHGTDNLCCFCMPTSSTTALSLWEKLRNLVDQTGYWPIVNNYRELSQGYRTTVELEDIIAQAEEIDVNKWFAERKERKAYEEDPASLLTYETSPWFAWAWGIGKVLSIDKLLNKWVEASRRKTWDLNIETWPENVKPSDTISISKSSRPDLYLDLIPTSVPWQVPVILGNPNDMLSGPDLPVHLAILKKWYEEYGAELVVHSGATFELLVAKPPTTKDAAIKLAVEHYLYCPDIVEQSLHDTIKARAAELLNGHTWYFWWD